MAELIRSREMRIEEDTDFRLRRSYQYRRQINSPSLDVANTSQSLEVAPIKKEPTPPEIFKYEEGIPPDVLKAVNNFQRRMKNAKKSESKGEPVVNRREFFGGIKKAVESLICDLGPSGGIHVPETTRDLKAVVVVGSGVKGKKPRDVDLRMVYEEPNEYVKSDVRLGSLRKVQGRRVDISAAKMVCDDNGSLEEGALPWVLQPHRVLLAPDLSIEEYKDAKQKAVKWVREHPEETKKRMDLTVRNRRKIVRRE